MQTRRWVNPTLPQTMQIAVFLLYFQAASTLVFGLESQYAVLPGTTVSLNGTLSNLVVRLGLPVAFAASAYFIANERKRGYLVGLIATALPLVCRLLIAFGISFSSIKINGHPRPWDYDPVGLLFEGALFALLLHPQSRDYQRIWFK
jgi:hypothetical protein